MGGNLSRARRFRAAALASGGLLLPGFVTAQYYDDPGLGSQPVYAHPQDYKPLGIRAGVFMLYPGVQFGAEYTDNVLYGEDGEQSSDTIFHIRPYVTAQSTWSKHSLAVTLSADVARHADFSVRDYEDYFFGVSGRIDVRTRSVFNYSLDYLDLHEDLNSRGSAQGIEPTRYSAYGGSVGYDHTFNRLSVGGSLGFNRLDYDDVADFDGDIIDNQDRDRDETRFSLTAGYQFQTDKQAFLTYSGYATDYDQEFDRNGFDRSGDGYSLRGGLNFTITGKLVGDVSVGYHERDYDDPQLPKTDGWAGGAGLTWLATPLTTVYGNIASSIQDTTNANSSGYLQTAYSLRVDHELRRHIQLNAFASYRTYDYQSIDPDLANARSQDDAWRLGLGGSWFVNRHAFLNASYTWETLESSVPNDDYTVNRVWLILGLEY